MQVKIVPSKEKYIYKQDPEMLAPSLGPSSFMMEWGKVENGPVVWPIKIRIFVIFFLIMDTALCRVKMRGNDCYIG